MAAVVLLGFAFLFGGASRQHELRLALVELSALPLLLLTLLASTQREILANHKFALSLLTACVALPVLQLIPLPPGVWTAFPGRGDLVTALAFAGHLPGWSSLSLTPDRTWQSLLALIPPVAMFLGALLSPDWLRVRFARIVLGATVLFLLIGAAQLASGGDQLYPWRTTDTGNVVGLFANRNHLATLCLMSLPFAVILGAAPLRRGNRSARLSLWLSIIYVALIVISLGVIRSRFGIVLLVPILGLSFVAAWVATGRGRLGFPLLASVGAATVAGVTVTIFALGPILERFDAGTIHEGRFDNWPYVITAANTYLPLGSGLGSFDAVYRSVEPLRLLDPTFFNQAHNEYLETWLEAGWLGAGLVVAFLAWFLRRSWSAWRASPSTARDLQRAASIGITVVLLHSAVDYPLRTETIAVLFAFCCGLLELASSTKPRQPKPDHEEGRAFPSDPHGAA